MTHIWVEGGDDSRFFESVLKPRMNQRFQIVEIIEYASKPTTWLKNFILTIKKMNNEYIFVHDFNSNKCIMSAKDKLGEKYPWLEKDHIVIVKAEIESWYVCGLKMEDCKKLGFPYKKSTESIIKDRSYKKKLTPRSKIAFTLEILNR